MPIYDVRLMIPPDTLQMLRDAPLVVMLALALIIILVCVKGPPRKK